MHSHGIQDLTPKKTINYDVTEESPLESPTIDSKGVTYPSRASDLLKSFTGCNRVQGWLEYLVDKEARFPIYEDRVNYIARHAEKFSPDQIAFINSNTDLAELALYIHFRPSKSPEFYPIAERGV
jgi:hypothetical protein